MKSITNSMTLCRLCGKENENVFNIYQYPDLLKDLVFYLPLDIKMSSPFPKGLCQICHDEFYNFKAFFIKLNEGQSILTELLTEVGISVKTMNYLTDRKTLFPSKFPCMPKVVPSASHFNKTKIQESPEKVIIERSTKRIRKMPTRLLESVQGNDLEQIFNKQENPSNDVENDNIIEEAIAKNTSNPETVESFKLVKTRSKNQCDMCGKVFKFRGRLINHKNTAHKGEYYRCTTENCGKKYKTKESIELHHKTVNHDGSELGIAEKYICEYCHRSYDSKTYLDDHVIEEHFTTERAFQCMHCLERLNTFDELNEHSIKEHGTAPKSHELSCHICDNVSGQNQTFPLPSFLYKHMQKVHYQKNTHTEPTLNLQSHQQQCPICQKVFKTKHLLTRHLSVVHTEDRPFGCDNCDLKFKSMTNLKAHQLKHSGEKKFSCKICQKLFGYKTSLLHHMKMHENVKPYGCPHCKKRFTQNGNLQEHIRIHTGEKPFVCSFEDCGRSFTTSSQHRNHEKRHRGEKPWQCDLCAKAFLQKESYKNHIRRHKGEKPFSCEFCSKAFTEVWALKKHKRLHTGERPYKCKHCPKAFADSSNLTKHAKSHTKPFSTTVDNEVLAKDGTVWNIIDHATSEANQDGNPSGANDVQQIIYIAYDDNDISNKETSVHIVNQNTLEPLETQHVELDLSQFPAEVATATDSSENPNPSNTTTTTGEGHLISSSHAHCASADILQAEDGSTTNKMDTVNVQAATTSEANDQIVYLSIRDGQQNIRLKVPCGKDPITYAKEYLESVSDANDMLT